MIKAEKIYDQSFTALDLSSSPKSSPTLEGDLYDYEIVIMNDDASADSILDVTCNSDTTANYRNYEIKGLGTSKTAAVGDSNTAIELQNFIGTANPNLLIMKITGSSGDERYIESFYSGDGAILKQSSFWKNTASELTSLTFTAATSVTCDIHIIIYRTPKVASQSRWELIKTVSLTSQDLDSAASPIDFTVDGDRDIKYKISFNLNSSTTEFIQVRPNSDSSSSNYATQWMRNIAGSLGSTNATSNTSFRFASTISGTQHKGNFYINAESGVDRICTSSYGGGTTGNDQNEAAHWWLNSADNLTSLLFFTDSASSVSGTVKLYRLRNSNGPTGDTLPFETVKVVDVSGDFSAGNTFSIDCDDFKLVKIEGLFSTVGNDLRIQYDADTGSNYTDQYLKGVSSTSSAATSTTTYHLLCDASASKVASFELYLYPKSGENRPALLRVSHGEDSVEHKALWWLNSADEINSFKIFASSTTTCTGTITYSVLR